MITLVIVDDQRLIGEGLRVVLDAQPGLRVIGIAHDGAEALAVIDRQPPDIVLMDLKMPGMNGIHATRAVKAAYPGVLVIVLTTYDEDEWVVDAIRAGADGYLLKDTGTAELTAALHGAMAGRKPIDPAIADKLFAYVQHGVPPGTTLAAQFTERERHILYLLASGLTNAAIADRLSLAEGTIRNHITLIFEKMGVTDRAQATAYAWRYGLVRGDYGELT